MKLSLFIVLCAFLAWAVWQGLYTGPIPSIGTRAPNFTLQAQDGTSKTIDSYAGHWLVLYFYPKDDTPGCISESCSLRDGYLKLKAAGATVAGVSVGSMDSHRRFAGKYQLPFDLLADPDGSTSRKYGVLMDWKLYRMAKRVTFLVDPQGIIRQIYPDVDTSRHAEQVLRTLGSASRATPP